MTRCRRRESCATDGAGRWIAVLAGLLAILAFHYALGLFATALNALFYSRYGPFFDSMSYWQALASLQANAAEHGGLQAALATAFKSTVAYPWLIAALFAKNVAASRESAVWIQLSAAFVMQALLFFYFSKVRALSTPCALVYSSLFSLIAAVFFFNGGLSDFRMDLLQYFFMTTVMAAYLIARASDRILWWALLGVCSALLCLARTTSPIYLGPIFLALAGADLLEKPSLWRQIVWQWGVTGIVAVALAGWYYVGNFRYLYYYYVVWNSDANARLPLALSRRHLSFVIADIGPVLLTVLAVIALGTAVVGLRQHGNGAWRRVAWRPLLFSVVPIGYLIFSGAGLNPFVSMVGCGGVIMFLLDPLSAPRASSRPAIRLFALVLLAAGIGSNVAQAIANHTRADRIGTWIPRQEGLNLLVDAMVGAAERDGKRRAYTYSVAHIGSLADQTLSNTLIYDHGFRFQANLEIERRGVRFKHSGVKGGAATAVEAAALPGGTETEKVAALAQALEERTDVVVIATGASALPEHVYGTRFVSPLREQLLASRAWEQIAEVTISPIESVLVLKNRRRMDTSPLTP